MKNLVSILLALAAIVFPACRERTSVEGLPPVVHAEGGSHHVQGIACDRDAGFMYFSFTTSFVKTDLQGKVIGTLDYVNKIAGASANTLQEDGSLVVELQVITGATNETGFNMLSAR